tara:strand:+ start:71 stop:511 length:441 start_codon:yes stop_codon:yes gene_type:complete
MKISKAALLTTVVISTFALTACNNLQPAHQAQKHTQHNSHHQGADVVSNAKVIEIASFKLKPSISYGDFAVLDHSVEVNHVAKQKGFVSRESAMGENGEWVVVVHWETLADADASMTSFTKTPMAAEFMGSIDLETMAMNRYTLVD